MHYILDMSFLPQRVLFLIKHLLFRFIVCKLLDVSCYYIDEWLYDFVGILFHPKLLWMSSIRFDISSLHRFAMRFTIDNTRNPFSSFNSSSILGSNLSSSLQLFCLLESYPCQFLFRDQIISLS